VVSFYRVGQVKRVRAFKLITPEVLLRSLIFLAENVGPKDGFARKKIGEAGKKRNGAAYVMPDWAGKMASR